MNNKYKSLNCHWVNLFLVSQMMKQMPPKAQKHFTLEAKLLSAHLHIHLGFHCPTIIQTHCIIFIRANYPGIFNLSTPLTIQNCSASKAQIQRLFIVNLYSTLDMLVTSSIAQQCDTRNSPSIHHEQFDIVA